mgnify:CR=1 FL=1|jgi:hypothetical protein
MRAKITSCLIKNLLESRQNVLETASGCSRQYVGTYPLLRRDVSDATSGRNFFYVVCQNCKKAIENAQHCTGEKVFLFNAFLFFAPKFL